MPCPEVVWKWVVMADRGFRDASTFWDREIHERTHVSWMEHPRVREYINRHFGGAWPLDWFQRLYPGRRFRRVLSIGCGTGAFERDLIKRDLCERADAFDGSVGSIAAARRAAAETGVASRIHYFVADFNDLCLRGSVYDAVFFHQSLHHVASLEKLLRRLLSRMRRGAILYLDEYIGPSRTDWNDESMAVIRHHYDRIPRAARFYERMPLPIQPDDPSEAIRSSEIRRQVEIGFDIEAMQGYGGNVLSVLFPAIDWSASAGDDLLTTLIATDERLANSDGPFHAVLVARPRTGLGKLIAQTRYFVEPKWRRVKWEISTRLGREAKF